jgi:UDP-4-amino-4,6-dideoxy-N-acetyl-beta-L-altrosamine transaminase
VIPYGKQDINKDDIDSVIEALESDFLTQGPKVPLFEKMISDYCDAAFGVAVNSATSALHIACLAIGLKKGDWLWTSPNSFVASANCALYCGAKVSFVDIDPKTYNISVEYLEEKLIKAKQENKLPKIVIPVHFAGQSCEMKKIHSLSKEYGFRIIEDASHAIGGMYLNAPIGNCKYSDITVFSFHPVKIITTAEGGLATTNSKQLADKMNQLRTHGINRDKELMVGPSEGEWYYQQVDLGFNYRMTELNAALGINQLKRLNNFVESRRNLKKRYDDLLSDLPIVRPFQIKDSNSSFHLYPIQINLNNVKKSRKQIFDTMRQHDIGVNIHYIPIHRQPYFSNLGFKIGDFPNAEKYYSRAISIPLFPSMSEDQQNIVVNTLKMVLK